MQDANTPPTCPGCGGSHYPATNGAGLQVWCDSIPATFFGVTVPDNLPTTL
jgi:hypothetical protein